MAASGGLPEPGRAVLLLFIISIILLLFFWRVLLGLFARQRLPRPRRVRQTLA